MADLCRGWLRVGPVTDVSRLAFSAAEVRLDQPDVEASEKNSLPDQRRGIAAAPTEAARQ